MAPVGELRVDVPAAKRLPQSEAVGAGQGEAGRVQSEAVPLPKGGPPPAQGLGEAGGLLIAGGPLPFHMVPHRVQSGHEHIRGGRGAIDGPPPLELGQRT